MVVSLFGIYVWFGLGCVAVTIALSKKNSSLKHYSYSSEQARELFAQTGFSVVWSKKFFGYTKIATDKGVEYEGFIVKKRELG